MIKFKAINVNGGEVEGYGVLDMGGGDCTRLAAPCWLSFWKGQTLCRGGRNNRDSRFPIRAVRQGCYGPLHGRPQSRFHGG